MGFNLEIAGIVILCGILLWVEFSGKFKPVKTAEIAKLQAERDRFQKVATAVLKYLSVDEKTDAVASFLDEGDEIRLLFPEITSSVNDTHKDDYFILELGMGEKNLWIYVKSGMEKYPLHTAIDKGMVTMEILDTVLTSYLTQ